MDESAECTSFVADHSPSPSPPPPPHRGSLLVVVDLGLRNTAEKTAKTRSGSDSRNLAALEEEEDEDEEETLTDDEEDDDEDEEEEDLDEASLAPDDFWCCESAAADDEGEPSSEMEMEGERSVESGNTRR